MLVPKYMFAKSVSVGKGEVKSEFVVNHTQASLFPFARSEGRSDRRSADEGR